MQISHRSSGAVGQLLNSGSEVSPFHPMLQFKLAVLKVAHEGKSGR
jgi:hypothetical protein